MSYGRKSLGSDCPRAHAFILSYTYYRSRTRRRSLLIWHYDNCKCMIDSLLNPTLKEKALATGQRAAAERRKKRRQHPSTNRGRPRKESGVYYNHQILASEEAFNYIVSQRYQRNEPIGAVLDRILMKNIERKKEEALQSLNGHVTDIFLTNRHKSFDSILEALNEDE